MESQFVEVYVVQYGPVFPTVQNPRISHHWAIIFMLPLPSQLTGVSYGAVGYSRMLQVPSPQRASSTKYKGRCRIGRIASHVFFGKDPDSARAKLLATSVHNDLPGWNSQDWVVDALARIEDLGEFSKDLSVTGIQRKLDGVTREDPDTEMMLKDMKLL